MLNKIRHRFKNRVSDGFLKHSILLMSFHALSFLGTFLYRKLVSSGLSMDDFGVFTAINALYGMMVIPMSVFSVFLSRNIAICLKAEGRDRALLYQHVLVKRFMMLTLFFSVLLVVASPILMKQYHLMTVAPVILAIMMFVGHIFASLYTASLQSFQAFRSVGVIGLIQNLAKLVLFILFFQWIFPRLDLHHISTYNFAILISLFGIVLGGIIGYGIFKKKMRSVPEGIPATVLNIKSVLKELAPIALLLFIFGSLKGIDEYFVRHYLRDNSGLYGAVITVGKSSIFMISGIIFILFPKLSSSITDVVASRRIMLKGLFLTFLVFIAVFLAVSVFPRKILVLMTHEKYAAATEYIMPFFIAYFPYSFVYVFVNFFIVHHDRVFLGGFSLLFLAQIVLYILFHNSVNEIILLLGISGYAMLLFSAACWWLRYARRGGVSPRQSAKD